MLLLSHSNERRVCEVSHGFACQFNWLFRLRIWSCRFFNVVDSSFTVKNRSSPLYIRHWCSNWLVKLIFGFNGQFSWYWFAIARHSMCSSSCPATLVCKYWLKKVWSRPRSEAFKTRAAISLTEVDEVSMREIDGCVPILTPAQSGPQAKTSNL